MKKRMIALFMSTLMVLSLAACGSKQKLEAPTAPTEEEVTEKVEEAAALAEEDKQEEQEEVPATQVLVDFAGREVELPVPVKTCVVADRYNSEFIRACGAVDRIIAVDMNTAQDRTYWGMFDPENVIAENLKELNYEKIIALNPQVVLVPDLTPYEEAAEKLEPFGIQVFVLSAYVMDAFEEQTEAIGKMFGTEEQAQKFYSYFHDKLEYVAKQLEGVEKRTVYFETVNDYGTAFEGSSYYNMLKVAQTENIFSTDTEGLSAKEIDPEAVIARNPDVIIKLITASEALSGTGVYTAPTKEDFKNAYDNICGRVGWDSISAVQNDDIYFMTQFSHGGAAKMVGALYVAKMVYPDLLPDLEPEEAFRAWLEEFQGFDYVPGHFCSAADLKN